MTEIQFSPDAVENLKNIKAYITEELCNDQAAVHILASITARIRELAAFPQIGTPLSSIVDLNTDYRFLICGHYTAFYLFENQTISIIRVLYGRRNFMRILFGEPKEKK